jgi:hypothetical protein
MKTNGKIQKLSSKHVSGGERAGRAGIFLEKIKISADSGKHVAKKLFFIETNHICTELLQKTDSQRLFRP